MMQFLETLYAAQKSFLNSNKLFMICSKREKALKVSRLIDHF